VIQLNTWFQSSDPQLKVPGTSVFAWASRCKLGKAKPGESVNFMLSWW